MSLYEIGKWPVSRDDATANEHPCGRLGTPEISVPGAARTAPAPIGPCKEDPMADQPTPDTPARKPIPRRLRFEILRRDQHTCRYCGAQAPDVALTVDHVIPVALGGSDEPTNLVTACRDCNSGKGSTSPSESIVEDVDATAILFAKAMERAAEIRAADGDGLERVLIQFHDDVWLDWSYEGRDGERHHIPLPSGWRTSIERFVEHGFTIDDFRRFVRVAMESQATHQDKFRYLCGCLWRELGQRQELARQLIEDGEV